MYMNIIQVIFIIVSNNIPINGDIPPNVVIASPKYGIFVDKNGNNGIITLKIALCVNILVYDTFDCFGISSSSFLALQLVY